MRKNIIQSKTEPNKNDIWLSEEGLKKYGKNGWEPLGGGNSSNSGGSNFGDYTDMMVLNTRDNAVLTEEQFNEIKERINTNSRFKIEYKESDGTLTYICYGIPYSLTKEELYAFVPQNSYYSAKDSSFTDDICFFAGCVNNEYSFGHINTKNTDFELPILKTPKFYYTGNGTKFLSDDGTYKEVSGGGGPVIIEYPNGSNEEIAITDEQIEAVKNGNVKIKLTMTGTTNYIILAPISIAITKEGVEIIVRSYFGENIIDAALFVDFTNKIIRIPE